MYTKKPQFSLLVASVLCMALCIIQSMKDNVIELFPADKEALREPSWYVYFVITATIIDAAEELRELRKLEEIPYAKVAYPAPGRVNVWLPASDDSVEATTTARETLANYLNMDDFIVSDPVAIEASANITHTGTSPTPPSVDGETVLRLVRDK